MAKKVLKNLAGIIAGTSLSMAATSVSAETVDEFCTQQRAGFSAYQQASTTGNKPAMDSAAALVASQQESSAILGSNPKIHKSFTALEGTFNVVANCNALFKICTIENGRNTLRLAETVEFGLQFNNAIKPDFSFQKSALGRVLDERMVNALQNHMGTAHGIDMSPVKEANDFCSCLAKKVNANGGAITDSAQANAQCTNPSP